MCYSQVEAAIKFLGQECVILFLYTPLYEYTAERALGFHLYLMNINTHVCFGNGEKRNAHKISARKPQVRRSLWIPRRTYRDMY